MALKFKLTKAEYEGLNEVLKEEYVASGGGYTLDVDGGLPADPKADEKFTKERDRRRAAEKRATEAETKITELEDRPDVATLEAKHAKELKKVTEERDGIRNTYNKYADSKERDAIATDLANKLAPKGAKVLKPHILERLQVDMTGDAPKTVILKDGKPSEMTVDQLAQEFRDNKDFSAIVVASQASGGHTKQPAPTGGSGIPSQAGQSQIPGPTPASQLSPSQMVERVNARRAAAGLETV